MSDKNDKFNIDDLLNMPNLASEFNQTSELKLMNNKDESNEINSIDDLLKTNLNLDKSSKPKEKIIPPPPPIIPNIEKENNFKVNDDFEPSITSAIDLDDFVLNNEEADNETQITKEIEEKIDTMIETQSFNDYYKNIEETQNIKKVNDVTRIYFDDDIKEHLEKDDDKKINGKNIEEKKGINDEIEKDKKKYFSKVKEKTKEFKENLSNVAQHYKFEYKYLKFIWYVSIFLNICGIAALSLGSYAIFGLGISVWLYLPISIFVALCFSYFIVNTIKIKSMKKELRNNGYQLSKENATATITGIYKKLITVNYYLNWSALSLYVVSGLLILMTFVVCYFIILADRGAPMPTFGDLIIDRGTNNSPLIVVWTFASLCFVTIIIQLIYNPLNIYRRNQIEVFYGKPLISEEMIEKYRKSANKKGMAIFIVSTAITALVVLIVYFVLKKRKTR